MNRVPQSLVPFVHTPNNHRGTRLSPHTSLPSPWTLQRAIGHTAPAPSAYILRPHPGPKKDQGPQSGPELALHKARGL